MEDEDESVRSFRGCLVGVLLSLLLWAVVFFFLIFWRWA